MEVADPLMTNGPAPDRHAAEKFGAADPGPARGPNDVCVFYGNEKPVTTGALAETVTGAAVVLVTPPSVACSV